VNDAWESSLEKVKEIISAGYSNNWGQRKIARDLNKEGLRTKSGTKWTQPTVSAFAREHLSLRRLSPNIKRPKKAKEPEQLPLNGQTPAWTEDVLTVLASSLSDGIKAKVVRLIVEEAAR
jgi:phage protein D